MVLPLSALSFNCSLLHSLIWRDDENQSSDDFGDTLVNNGSTGISERPLTPKHSPVEAAMMGVVCWPHADVTFHSMGWLGTEPSATSYFQDAGRLSGQCWMGRSLAGFVEVVDAGGSSTWDCWVWKCSQPL